jgi:purine nucleoside phosphorylase
MITVDKKNEYPLVTLFPEGMNMTETIDLAIIGGTGLQKFAGLPDVETREVQTRLASPARPL